MSLSLLLRLSAESPESASIEELVKAFSRVFLEAEIVSTDDETISNSSIHFPQTAVPKNIQHMTELEARFKEPLFMSKILHLCAHIRYTSYNDHIAQQESPLQDVLWWLEDIKTESFFLKTRSIDTVFFRYKTREILERFSQLDDPSALDLSLLYLNIAGRLQSGITYNYEVQDMHNKLLSKIPENTQNQFSELLNQFLSIPIESDGLDAVLIAKRWIDLTDRRLNHVLNKKCMDDSNLRSLTNPDSDLDSTEFSDEKTSDSVEQSSSEAEQDEETDNADDIQSEETETAENLESMFEDDDVEDNDTESDQSQVDSTPSDEKEDEGVEESIKDLADAFTVPDLEVKKSKPLFDEKKLAEEAAHRKELERMKSKSKQVFPKEYLQYQSRLPTDSDYRLASQLANMFRKAKWRAPTKSTVRDTMPPGRLNSRDAVTQDAQIKMGIPSTVEPFRRTVYAKAESPPLLLGMACDISGSMSASTGPMAQLMWACARAVPKVGGEFSAVSFGRTVKGLVKPGQKINKVPILTARANYEEAYGAITALIGALGWMQPKKSGIRILLISSDSEWRPDQLHNSGQLLTNLAKNHGVHVFWIPFQGNIDYKRYNRSIYKDAIPMFRVGTIVSFDTVSNIPLELGKIISNEVRIG